MLKKSQVLEILDNGGMVTWSTFSNFAFVWSGPEHERCYFVGFYPLRFAKALSASGKFHVQTTPVVRDGYLVYCTKLYKGEGD